MKIVSTILLLLASIVSGCNSDKKVVPQQLASSTNLQNSQPSTSQIDSNSAVEIAKADYLKGNKDFPELVVRVREEDKNWLVTFMLKEDNGGPAYYTIDKMTGEIVEKRIYK